MDLKDKIGFIVSGAVVIIAIATKPNKKSFVDHIQKDLKKDGGIMGNIGSALAPLALNDATMKYNDLLFCAVMETPGLSEGQSSKYFGIFGKWFKIA